MYLGNLWIAPEEIERIAWREGELRLDVRWRLEDVPVLYDLPEESLLRWHADDPEAGIPVKLNHWSFCREIKQLRLLLRR